MELFQFSGKKRSPDSPNKESTKRKTLKTIIRKDAKRY
jgi:hypothetical protein